jgi:hypothetical protein
MERDQCVGMMLFKASFSSRLSAFCSTDALMIFMTVFSQLTVVSSECSSKLLEALRVFIAHHQLIRLYVARSGLASDRARKPVKRFGFCAVIDLR